MSFDLYNKYRPISWDDIYGQDIEVEVLRNSIKKDKKFHSLIFFGPKGSGKTTIARIYSMALNCSDLVNESDPCLKCDSCISIIEKNNLDVQEIDAASNNGVDDIRKIKENILITPKFKNRVYIIDECHMLSKSAFNALLKLLEEPPRNTTIILATTELEKVPDTVFSRCVTFRFKEASEENIFNKIKNICQNENVEIDESAIKIIAENSDKSLRNSLSILEKLLVYKSEKINEKDVMLITNDLNNKIIFLIIKSVINLDINSFLKISIHLDKNNICYKKVFKRLLRYFHYIYLYKKLNNEELLKGFSDQEKEIIKLFSNKVQDNSIKDIIEHLISVSERIEHTINPKYFFDILVTDCIEKIRGN